jgi:hypothetical protein
MWVLLLLIWIVVVLLTARNVACQVSSQLLLNILHVNTLSGPYFLDLVLLVMGMNTTKTVRYFNQNYNKGKLSSKSRSWNKKNKKNNTTNVNKNPKQNYCKK